MTDWGFQITEGLMMKYCTLNVPSGASIKSQMTNSEIRETKKIANLRIHVELAINRIKSYRILKSLLPITVLRSCDDIRHTCAGLWNLKSLLFKNSTTTEWYLLLWNVISCKSIIYQETAVLSVFYRFIFESVFCGMILENIFSKKALLDMQCLKSLICFEILFLNFFSGFNCLQSPFILYH